MKRFLAVVLFLLALLPVFAQEREKPIIAVLDFSTDGVSRSEMKTIINLLSSALFQTRRFTVIDVNERDRLLQELEFSVGECTDESCLLEVGRMLSAERIVLGNIGKVGSRYILSTKMLETETARTLNTADGIYTSLDALVDDLFNLAEKLAGVPGSEGAAAAAASPAAPEPETGAATAGQEGEAPAAPEEPAAAARKRERPSRASKPARPARPGREGAPGTYWSLRLGAGADIALGAVSEAVGLGVPARVRLAYVLERDWGVLAFEGLSGIEYQGTKRDVRYGYHLLSVPLGVGVRYSTRWASPWYLTASAAGGATFNFVLYKEAYPFRDNLFNISPFAAPSVGVGYRLSPRLSLELDTLVWMVFYHDVVYVGLAPTFGVELALGERAAPATAAEPAEAEGPAAETGPDHLYLTASAGTNIPLGAMAEAVGLGIPALVSFGYTLERPWGSLGFAGLTGFQYQGTRRNVRYGYDLLSAPLGAEVRYAIRGASPWYLTAGAAGGVTFNYVIYEESYPFRDNLLDISAFAAPMVGGGYRLSPRLALELDAWFWMVFYDEAVYFGATPTFGMKLAL